MRPRILNDPIVKRQSHAGIRYGQPDNVGDFPVGLSLMPIAGYLPILFRVWIRPSTEDLAWSSVDVGQNLFVASLLKNLTVQF